MKLIRPACAVALLLALMGTSQAADALAADPAVDWSGSYLGVNVAHGQGVATRTDDFLPGVTFDDEMRGWSGGIQAGYNIQSGGLVFGLEGEASLSGIATPDDPTMLPRDVNWMAALRGRGGVSVAKLLFYATAGVTTAGMTGTLLSGDESDSQTHFGWTAGAGVEAMLTDSLSAKLEYSYSGFEAATYDYPDLGISLDADFHVNAIKAGINFHF